VARDSGLVPYGKSGGGQEPVHIRARRIEADPEAQQEWDEYWEHVQAKARKRRAEAPGIPPHLTPTPELEADYTVTRTRLIPAMIPSDYPALPELPAPVAPQLPAPRLGPPKPPRRKALPAPAMDPEGDVLWIIGAALVLISIVGAIPKKES
jgi:hypothetical protein